MTSSAKPLVRFKKTIRGELNNAVSEFGLSTSAGEKVDVGRLVSALDGVKAVGDLKKQLTTAGKRSKTLDAPLHRQAKERIERKVAYDEAKKRVGFWDEVVRQNRLADKLVFPLPQQQQTQTRQTHATLENAIGRFEPRTPLEIETARILGQSKHNLTGNIEYTEAEKELLQSMSLEEAEKRKDKLCKLRALITYEQAKSRRKRNVKSKRYHRIAKKQKRKEIEQQFLQLLRTNPQLAREKLELLDADRIKERSTLKHRSTGKWAKQIRRLAQKDPELREALQTQLRLGKELAEKIAQPTESDDSDSDESVDAATGGVESVLKKSATTTVVDLTPKLAQFSAEVADEEQTNLIAEAFADDDVVEAEMDEHMNNSSDDETLKNKQPTTGQLPGWNSWTGPGIVPNKRQAKKERRKLSAISKEKSKRKRATNVVFNEQANESIKKYQVKQIPFPFSKPEAFEANLSYPLGREWNPETAFKLLVEPTVRTRMGAIIKPMDKSFVAKTNKRKFKRMQQDNVEATDQPEKHEEHISL